MKLLMARDGKEILKCKPNQLTNLIHMFQTKTQAKIQFISFFTLLQICYIALCSKFVYKKDGYHEIMYIKVIS